MLFLRPPVAPPYLFSADPSFTMIKSSTAVLAVADVSASAAFYVDVLGFKKHWLWGDPPTFGSVGDAKHEIFLCQQPELAQKVDGHMHFFHADCPIDELHDKHRAAGAPIVSPIENKPWGLREYTVRDPSGYHLRFAGTAKYERPPAATDALPPHIRLDVALPELQTYRALFSSVSWTPHERMAMALEKSEFGVTATDTRDGQTVGMVRVVGDGKNYTFWDVIVRPSHQGQKIGSAMMEEALAELRRRGIPEGAFVGLFAFKVGFYEKLGFKQDSGMHRPL